MGYIKHHAIIVTSYSREHLARAHTKAGMLFAGVTAITPMMPGHTSSFESFAVLPDGSKEGWDESDNGDAARIAFKRWLDRQRWSDGSSPLEWCEVFYSADDRASGTSANPWEGVAVGDSYDGPRDLEGL